MEQVANLAEIIEKSMGNLYTKITATEELQKLIVQNMYGADVSSLDSCQELIDSSVTCCDAICARIAEHRRAISDLSEQFWDLCHGAKEQSHE